jgi:hypothetical protein
VRFRYVRFVRFAGFAVGLAGVVAGVDADSVVAVVDDVVAGPVVASSPAVPAGAVSVPLPEAGVVGVAVPVVPDVPEDAPLSVPQPAITATNVNSSPKTNQFRRRRITEFLVGWDIVSGSIISVEALPTRSSSRAPGPDAFPTRAESPQTGRRNAGAQEGARYVRHTRATKPR